MLLPSDTTKASVYRLYAASSEELRKKTGNFVRYFGYREFCRLWNEVTPYIRTMLPAEDICQVCQENAAKIMQSANCTENEKRDLLLLAQHLELAKKQRYYYKQVEKAKKM